MSIIVVVVEKLRIVGLCLLVIILDREVKYIVNKEVIQIKDEIEMGRMACFLSISIARFDLELVEETMFSMASGESL